MQFGDKIRMLRDYDDGRYAAGEVYVVDVPGEPEDGKIRPNIARSLCGASRDGQGPYAEIIDDDHSTDDDQED